MTTWAELERPLLAVVGKTEQPPNSNHIFVWDDLIAAGLAPAWFQGSPYCAAGMVWDNLKAHAPQLPVQSPFYVPSRIQFARAHGLWDTSGHYHPGDEVCFAWTPPAIASGLGEHVERVLSDDGHTIETVGFNTSAGTIGSQTNGDGVFKRDRPHGATVLGAIAYSRLLTAPVHLHPRKHNPFGFSHRALHLTTPHFHGDDVRALQWAAGVPVDGDFGPLTDHGLRHFQRFHFDPHHHRLAADGVQGPLTLWALEQITHWQH